MGRKIPNLVLVLWIFSAAVAADYVRPQPRKTLDFPWERKPSSYPQQVKNFAILALSFSVDLSFREPSSLLDEVCRVSATSLPGSSFLLISLRWGFEFSSLSAIFLHFLNYEKIGQLLGASCCVFEAALCFVFHLVVKNVRCGVSNHSKEGPQLMDGKTGKKEMPL